VCSDGTFDCVKVIFIWFNVRTVAVCLLMLRVSVLR